MIPPRLVWSVADYKQSLISSIHERAEEIHARGTWNSRQSSKLLSLDCRSLGKEGQHMPRCLLLLLFLLVNSKVTYFKLLSHGNSYLDNIEANNIF